MNPLTNALKVLTTTTYQIVLALVFFTITARVSDPAFFGQVAVVQLLEAFVGTVFFLVPQNVITRDVASGLAKGTHIEIAKSYLAYPLLTLPLYLFFLALPKYAWVAVPYLYLFLVQGVIQGIMYGADMYTEAAIVNAISATFRWGVSIVAVLKHSFTSFVGIWTVGALIAVIYGFAALRAKHGIKSGNFDVKLYFAKFLENKYLYGQALASFLSSQGDRLVTIYLLGQTDLGLYQFAALVASVPVLVLGTFISTSYLAAASYYRSKGVNELDISRPAFRIFSVIAMFIIILGIMASELLVPVFFPGFSQSLKALSILLLASLVNLLGGVPIASIVAFKRDQRPMLILAGLNSVAVVSFSLLLIPMYGIEGGASAQLITAILSMTFILYYSKSVNAVRYELKEILAIVVALCASTITVLVNNIALEGVIAVISAVATRLFKIVSEPEFEILYRFTPGKLRILLRIIRSAPVRNQD